MPAPASDLSPKEEEMVALLAKGNSDAQIASKMELKEGSISSPLVCGS